MKKREIIEGSFGSLCTQVCRDHYCETLSDFIDYLGDTLAEQAIAIECEVKHKLTGDDEYTALQDSQGIFEATWLCWGHHGTPGKALAIILPLEEER